MSETFLVEEMDRVGRGRGGGGVEGGEGRDGEYVCVCGESCGAHGGGGWAVGGGGFEGHGGRAEAAAAAGGGLARRLQCREIIALMAACLALT